MYNTGEEIILGSDVCTTDYSLCVLFTALEICRRYADEKRKSFRGQTF